MGWFLNGGPMWQFWLDNWQGLIAVAALMVAVHEGYALRKHNRLSVVPDLDTVTYYDRKPSKTRFVLRNHGLGPARIVRLEIFWDGKMRSGIGQREFLTQICQDMLKGMPLVEIEAGAIHGPACGKLCIVRRRFPILERQLTHPSAYLLEDDFRLAVGPMILRQRRI